MVVDGLDTRWWNLGAVVTATALLSACGPTVLLSGDTEGSAMTTGGDGDDDATTGPPVCTDDNDCIDGYVCLADGKCHPGPSDDNAEYSDEYTDYADYSDYSEEFTDYSDYADDFYYECFDHVDCRPGQLCNAEYGGYCDPVAVLPDCDSAPLFTEVLLQLPPGDDVVSLAFVDADGDPAADLVVGRASGAELVSGGSLSVQTLPVPAEGVTGAVAGDLDGDGISDLLLATDAGNLHVLTSNGMGGFTLATTTMVGSQLTDLALLDWDGGGLDLVAVEPSSGNLVLFEGVGDGSIGAISILYIGGASSATSADVTVATVDDVFANLDGQGTALYGNDAGMDVVLDLAMPERHVLAGDDSSSSTDALVGWSTVGTWTLIETVRAVGYSRVGLYSIAGEGELGDADGDGVQDLLLRDDQGLLTFVHGLGDPTSIIMFDCASPQDLPGDFPAFAVGDATGDGPVEIAVHMSGVVTIFGAS